MTSKKTKRKTKRLFRINFLFDDFYFVDYALVELDQELFDVVDDDWRSQLYDYHTDEEIANHIAYNLIINRIRLKQMDGWADKDNSLAVVIKWPNLDTFDMEAEEVKKT